MNYKTLLEHFPIRTLKLAPEIKAMSVVKSVDYPVQITNDNAPYALPYWHSQALARYILDHPFIFQGKSVVDVGCGSGVAAIAAAKVGAKAFALDPDLRCLDFSERNAAINEVSIDLIWGDHKTKVVADILLAGGVFHESHGSEIAAKARSVPSLIAVSECNLWSMEGFNRLVVHKVGDSVIHLFSSNKFKSLVEGGNDDETMG